MSYYITDFDVSGPGAVALEDSIMTRAGLTTAGSRMLGNFAAPFDAAVVERLRDAGMKVAGKTTMAEFGIAGTDRLPDGLSGATQAVAGGAAPLCLCNDLFGRYRREAAENGLCYIHPTYGTVSRYGLIPLASSMDQIGVMCRDMAEGFALLAAIAGRDARDGAMFPQEKYSYGKLDKPIRVCAPANVTARADKATQAAIADFAGKFDAVDGSLEYFEVYKQVMTILASAEISNNISRYDGVKFGYRTPDAADLESLYTKTRTEGFGQEAKLAAIMGAMVLSAGQYVPYYEKAMKLRRLIRDALSFEAYDVLVLPASIDGGPYEARGLYAAATLAGLPSVAFSYGGCGLQLVAGAKGEDALFTAWEVARR